MLAAGLVSFIPKPSRERETHTQIAEPLVELERGDAGRESVGEASGEGSVQLSTLHSPQKLSLRLERAGGDIVGVERVGKEGSCKSSESDGRLGPFDDSLFLPFEAPAKA